MGRLLYRLLLLLRRSNESGGSPGTNARASAPRTGSGERAYHRVGWQRSWRERQDRTPPVISGLLASIGLLAIRGGLAHASRVPFQYLWPIHWVPGFFSPCAAVSSAVAVEGVYSLSD